MAKIFLLIDLRALSEVGPMMKLSLVGREFLIPELWVLVRVV